MVVIQLQVFNLTEVKPHESLETFAAKGDESARECRELIQIMVSNIFLQPLAMGIGFIKFVAMALCS